MVLGWEYGGHLKHAETPLCLCGNSLQVIFPGSTGATCHDLKSWNTPLRLEPKLLVFSWSERMHHFMDVWWKYARFVKKNVWKNVCFCPHLSELCKFSWWDESECVCNLSPNSNLTFTFAHFPSQFNFSVGGNSSQQPYWHAFHFHCYRYIFSFLLLL